MNDFELTVPNQFYLGPEKFDWEILPSLLIAEFTDLTGILTLKWASV